MNQFLEEIKRVKAISDVGLLYSKTDYDRERYEELREISLRMLALMSGWREADLKIILPPASDYPTAKVDIRGVLLTEDQKILLVRESADGKWSLPGGWADPGFSPSEVVIKEFKEETGLDVSAARLLAVFDKRKHNHPPQPYYVYKIVFLCKATSLTLKKGFDVLDVDFFQLNALPPMSEDRILASQIKMLVDIAVKNGPTYVD